MWLEQVAQIRGTFEEAVTRGRELWFCRNRKNQQTQTTTGSAAPQQVRYQ